MPVSPQFQDFILDMLAALQPTARRMFGGVGIMNNGTMFALLASDELYLRVDDQIRPRFEAEDCAPFGYNRAGRDVVIGSYYAVPARLYDNPEELVIWARNAIGAAERSGRKHKQKRNKSPSRRLS